VDVRVVAATNHNLRQAVAEKRFREDLFYRLSMVEILVPALAARKEDLPLLTRHFLTRFARQYGKEIRSLTHRAQIVLAMHTWPGNVRELENVIGHACMMCMGDTVDVPDLPPYLQSPHDRPVLPTEESDANVSSLEDQERFLVMRAMEEAGGNQSQAARILRIGRDALRYKLKKHGL
jgi:DNA-binding NtrC family response regulator